MKFSEYMEYRGKKSLSNCEAKIFKIEKTKGWIDRYAEQELTEVQVNRAIKAVMGNNNICDAIKGGLRKIQDKRSYGWDGKYLYFMINDVGTLKIGVSDNPVRRANVLTNESGHLVQCVAYWQLSVNARDEEQKLLKRFKKNKTYGEWFKANSLNFKDIESCFDFEYKRLFINPELAGVQI